MNNMLKVIISEDEYLVSKNDLNEFENYNMKCKVVAKNSDIILNNIFQEIPDIVVMDAFLENADAISVMRSFSHTNLIKPVFIIYSSYKSSLLERELINNGASYFACKPINMQKFAHDISVIFRNGTVFNNNINLNNYVTPYEIELKVTNLLNNIGVPAHIKGYRYLRDSIIMSIKNPTIMDSVTKQLYPSVAAKHGSTPSRVERAIRHAIEIAWDRGNLDCLTDYFDTEVTVSEGKPTNSELIAIVSDRLRLETKG